MTGATNGYSELQKILGFSDSAHLRRVLECLITEEQARLVTLLPASPEELANKLGIDIETVNSLLYDLHSKAVIVHKNFDPSKNFVPVSTYSYPENWFITPYSRSTLPELYGLYRDFIEEIGKDEKRWKAISQEYAKVKQPQWRVLPAYKSILDSPELLPEEDVRTVLKQAKIIAATPCGCRIAHGPCHQSGPMSVWRLTGPQRSSFRWTAMAR